MATTPISIVTAANVGVPGGVAGLNSSGAVPISQGGTGLTSLPDGALYAQGASLVVGPLPVEFGGTGTTTSTGTGALVRADSAILTSVVISGGSINGVSLGAVVPVSVNASSVTTQSLSVGGMTTTTSTGSGALVLATSPVLVSPDLGTPRYLDLTNATGLPLDTGVTGVLSVASGGTGAATLTGLIKGNGTAAMTVATPEVDYVSPSVLGEVNGVATLDAAGKLTASQVPDYLLGALNYQGTWDADLNVPALASGTGTKGWYFKVSVAGATDLDGITTWNLGDMAIYDGASWSKVDGVADQVLSVNGMTGAVLITRQLLGAAGAGANADITSLTGLTTALSVTQGGTGTTTSTGTGSLVLATSPVLVTPDLGTPSYLDLTNAFGLSLSTGVTDVLPVSSGGTGASTRQGAINTLAGAVTQGMYLRGDGTNAVMSPILSADIPTLNQNTTGTAASVTDPAQPTITSLGTLTSLTIEGATSFVGTASPLSLNGSAGISGQILTSSGPGATPTWASISGVGSVTSVNVSGSTSGLEFTGGPITSAGTITLSGVLSTGFGGTGVTTSTGSGSNVLSTSPVLVTPDLGTPSAVDLENATGLPLDTGTVGVLPIVSGGTGASTAANARTALGAAASGANTDISSLSGLTTALSVLQGGTGTTTSTGTGSVVLSASPTLTGTTTVASINTTGALRFGTASELVLNSSAGSAGQVLVSGGAGVSPAWQTVDHLGTVTSIDASGGTTGLSFSGGPVTTSGTLTMEGTLLAVSGGTGITSYVTGDLIYASGTTALAKLAAVASGNVLLSGGVGIAPTYGKVGLTTHVTGTLGVANGGTGTNTSTGSGANVLGTAPSIGNPVITGGTLNSTVIGGSSPAAGSFTALAATTSLNLAGAAVPFTLNGSAGTAGQVLTSTGPGATPTWGAAGTVTSVQVSGGTTGLSFSGGPVTSSGTLTMSGVLTTANGGTGVTTSTGTGSNVLSTSPTLTGTTNTSNLTTTGTLSLAGTGSPLSVNGSVGTAGQALLSAGPGATPVWTTLAGVGTVTSVQASGGTTGLSFSGGPITSSGTLTLAGVLAVTNGGTGASTSTGTGSVVLATSPTLTGTTNTSNLTTTGALTLAGAASPVILGSSSGTAGQILTSAGPGATPIWTSAGGGGSVSSVGVSGGTTGLTFSGGPITSSGTITMEGTLAVANGGTGVTTSTGSGSVVLSASPTFTGTVNAAAATFSGALSLSGVGAPVLLNGAPGTSGQVLTSAGPGSTPTWVNAGVGTVTSVQASGGTTGLSFTGGPVTSSGTLTLDGTLSATAGGTGITSYSVGDLVYASTTTALSKLADVAVGNVLLSGGVGAAPAYGKVELTTHVTGTLPVASGGTGVTTSTGSGANVLATSPTLVTPNLGTPSAINLANATGLSLTSSVTGVLPVANGGTGVTTSTGTGSNVLSASPTLTGTVTINGTLTAASTTSPIVLNASAGTTGQVLTSAGAGATPTWTTPSQGTVTSVQASGGTTGLSFTGGPVTSSGTLTMAGTLNVASGGTGVTTSTGSGANVLSASPTLTGTVTINGTLSSSSASFDSLAITNSLLLGSSAGTAGQVLISSGAGALPVWANTVSSFSGGTTGLTPSVTSYGAVTLAGTLAAASGGTGGNGTVTGSGSNVLSSSPQVAGLRTNVVPTVTAGSNAQGQGVLTYDLNVITTAAASPSGATLVTAVAGYTVEVVNATVNPVNVYPASGAKIDALATNAPILLPAGASVKLRASSATQWYSSVNEVINAVAFTGVLPVTSGGTGVTTSTGGGNLVLSASPSFTGTATFNNATVNSTLSLGSASPLLMNSVPGVVGQVLTSAGAGATPTWTTPSQGTVTSVQASGGTTGLSFTGGPVTSSGTLTLAGTLAVGHGGTGVTTSTGTGANVLSANPVFTGTVSAANVSASGTVTLSGAAAPLVLNSTPGTAGQVLTSAGAGATPTWTTLSTASGTVTSVQASGGTTGLSFSGGPVTSSGTLTLAGTLNVANGGTGVTTSTGSGANVLSTSPVLVTPNLGTPSAANLSNATDLPISAGTTGTLPVARGGTGVTTSTGSGSVVLATAPTITNARGVHVALGAGTSIDLNAGDVFTKTISGNTTFTVSNVPASGTFAIFALELTNGGSATVTLFSGVQWSGGVPTLTAAGRDTLVFYTHNGGATWTGIAHLDVK